MNRHKERILMNIGAVWNIVTGLLTVTLYSTWIEQVFPHLSKHSLGLNYLSDNLHSFVIVYGLLFVLIGCINLWLSKAYIDDISVQKKIPIWLIIIGLLSYFAVDIIGATCYVAAGVLMLAKNKAMAQLLKQQYE